MAEEEKKIAFEEDLDKTTEAVDEDHLDKTTEAVDEDHLDKTTELVCEGSTDLDLFQKEMKTRRPTLATLMEDADHGTHRRRSQWVKRSTVSYGQQAVDDDDMYYENEETGETMWEKPDDYLSEEEEEFLDDEDIMLFDRDATLREAYMLVDIIGSAATHERIKFCSGVKSVQKATEEVCVCVSVLVSSKCVCYSLFPFLLCIMNFVFSLSLN